MPGGRIALAIRGGQRPRAGGGEAPKRRCYCLCRRHTPMDLELSTGRRRCRGVKGFCRSEEHTSELQSLMRISYAVFCLNKKTQYALTTQQQVICSPRAHDAYSRIVDTRSHTH